MIHRRDTLRLGILGSAAAAAGLPAADASAQGDPGRADLSPGMTTVADTVRKVPFVRRPNVYLISFDAMTADSIASRYFDLPSPLKYTEAIEATGARVLRNAFADRVPTRPSLNSLCALDPNFYDGLSAYDRDALVTGNRLSPLLEIFRHNGYRVQTMHRSYHLGRKRGPYVDFYGVSSVEGVCDNIETRLAFLGYCSGRLRKALSQAVPGIDRSAASRPFIDLLTERIRVAAQSAQQNEPWLTIAYSLSPGHTSMSYDHSQPAARLAYRTTFNQNQVATAAEIQTAMTTIRQLDPDSIVLIFGDHGPIVIWNSERAAAFAAGPEFYIHTRHATRMAIWPAAACERELDEISRGGFITTAMAIRAIITNLSDGLDPLQKSVTYSLPYGKLAFGKGREWRYEDFLYDPAPTGRVGAPAISG